jgi:hypothetical protein
LTPRRCSQERNDVGAHPRGADFGCDPIEDFDTVPMDQKDYVVFRDLKASRALKPSIAFI